MSAPHKISRPQAEFIFSKKQFPAIIGGFGSGKSQAGTYRLITLLIADHGISVSHFFPSYKLAKRRGLTGVKKDLKALGYEFVVNKTDLTIYVPEVDGTIFLETYHDPDAIVSFEVAHAIVDELDTLEKEKAEYVWQKITERVRQRCNHDQGNTIGCVTTPDQGTNGFCFEKWGYGEHEEHGYQYIKAGTASNKFLPDGYVDQIRKNYDSVMAEAFIDGGWVSFTKNKVYHFFNRITHHSDRVITDKDYQIHIGLDFNIGGCCAVVFVIDNNDPIAVDEFVSYDTADFINNLERYKGKKIIVYPDASGKSEHTNSSQSDLSLISQAGYALAHNSTNPAIRDRINAYNALLSHNRLRVNTDKCTRLTNALESQGYDKHGAPEKWNIHPAIDDWADSSGYFIAYRYPITKPMQRVKFGGT